ncbi:MFS transporter [Vibrio parahaemolyticus]|nr:MFS transporter [Vibrio parahaemolyticus]EHR6682298.1 MFS transporter [Vibrio parahaemolyticus]EIV8484221.1 MFS transporter [Vibrio parahaemolyticus]EIV8623628.1 MFS transporter [Vibrio parahaemolyticus]MBE4000542.1 multidrug effflux MFS transporter [Vibrio parahaemolyticus]
MTTATKTAPMTNSVGLTLLAGLPLFTLLPFGLDIFLPAVYQIGEFFSDQGVPSMAISIYMLFWGLGQLFWGGMADTIGKKNIALIGLALFAFSSFMISTIDSDQAMQFLAFRALQSFAGSACFTAIFAFIRMRFEGEHLNKAYSYLNGILAFVPVSAPLAGAYIVETNSWFTLFTIMSVLGVVSIVWIFLTLPNDKKEQQSLVAEASNVTNTGFIRRYTAVIVNTRFKTFLFFALVAQSLFIYLLTVAPMYLMGKLEVSQVAFGQMFMAIAIVFMLGSFLSPTINARLSIKSLIAFSLGLIVTGGVLIFVMSDIQAWYSLIGPMVIIAIGCTMLLCSCPANALADFKENAGVASGLYTATTFGAGALISALFSHLIDSTDLSQVSLVYALFALFALAVFSINKTVKA